MPGVRLYMENEGMINKTNEEKRRKIGEEVKLLSVDLDTEGIYRCVVTTEGIFMVVRQQMTVAVFSKCLMEEIEAFCFPQLDVLIILT